MHAVHTSLVCAVIMTMATSGPTACVAYVVVAMGRQIAAQFSAEKNVISSIRARGQERLATRLAGKFKKKMLAKLVVTAGG